MKPGPRPRSLEMHRLAGNPSKLNLDHRERTEPRPPEGGIEPPSWLEGPSLEKWHEMLPIVQGMKVMTSADVDALGRYCVLHEMLVEAVASVRRDGVTMVVNEATGRRAQNPAVVIARGAAADLLRLGAEFGLTPSSRSVLEVDNGESAESVRAWLDANDGSPPPSLTAFAASRDYRRPHTTAGIDTRPGA